MKHDAIIVGAGTYGQVYASYLGDYYNIIGFIDDNPNIKNTKIEGIPILGDFEWLLLNKNICKRVFVPIGDNVVRVKFMEELRNQGFELPCFIHPSVQVPSNVEIGEGVYILAGCCLMPFVTIEDFTMISMGVLIAHHSHLKKGCFISQGSNVGANIVFEERVFCGIGAVVMTGVKTIGENVILGAGTVIIKDVPESAVLVGNPGRIVKFRTS